MISAGLLNRRVRIWRAMIAPDGQGGQTRRWDAMSTEPARLTQPDDSQRTAGAQHGADVAHSVYLGPAADVRRGDRLEVEPDGLGELPLLEVEAVLLPSAPAYVRADCTARQREGPWDA